MTEFSDFKKAVLDHEAIVDVRAPVEFTDGHLPGSVNLPILTDEERAEVGTTFKKAGREQALEVGHRLVSGFVRTERVGSWQDFLKSRPTALITCWRGGLRSQIAQQWLAEGGTERRRIQGGYRAFRQFLLGELDRLVLRRQFFVVAGMTGSGKTRCLEFLSSSPVLDLEKLAHHRGSAFGNHREPQPAQATFENAIAMRLIELDQHTAPDLPILLEDESRMVGRLVNPESLFNKLRASPVLLIEENRESRIQTIFEDYILQSGLLDLDPEVAAEVAARHRRAFHGISKKLGDERFRLALGEFEAALSDQDRNGPEGHRQWIGQLLDWYYDPLYRKSLEQRNPVIAFRGSRSEVSAFARAKTKG